MMVTEEIRQEIASYSTNCRHERCQAQNGEIQRMLLEALESDRVVRFQRDGGWLLNQRHARRVYAIRRSDGRELRIAPTYMSTIMVFSSRGRSTHCRPEEFSQRMEKFLRHPG